MLLCVIVLLHLFSFSVFGCQWCWESSSRNCNNCDNGGNCYLTYTGTCQYCWLQGCCCCNVGGQDKIYACAKQDGCRAWGFLPCHLESNYSAIFIGENHYLLPYVKLDNKTIDSLAHKLLFSLNNSQLHNVANVMCLKECNSIICRKNEVAFCSCNREGVPFCECRNIK